MTTSTDRSEKQVFLGAPRARVWRALTDLREFGEWFRVKLETGFAPGGTLLQVVESGFDALPVERRAEAFRMNEGGWAEQMRNVARHVSGSSEGTQRPSGRRKST